MGLRKLKSDREVISIDLVPKISAEVCPIIAMLKISTKSLLTIEERAPGVIHLEMTTLKRKLILRIMTIKTNLEVCRLEHLTNAERDITNREV